MPNHTRVKSHIPIIQDVEALEHARKCVGLIESSCGEDRPIGKRAIAELDRLIAFTKGKR